MPIRRRSPRSLVCIIGGLLLSAVLADSALANTLSHQLAALDDATGRGCTRARDAAASDELVLDPDRVEYAGWLRLADRITFALRRVSDARFRVLAADVEGEAAAGEASVESGALVLTLSAGRGPCRAGTYRWQLAEARSSSDATALRDRFATLFALKRDIEQSWEPLPETYSNLPERLAQTVSLTQSLLGARHPETLLARAYRADTFTVAQRAAEGLGELDAVMAEQAQVLPELDHDILRSRHFRIDLLVRLSRSAEAFAEAESLARDAQASLGDRHPLRWRILGSLERRYLDAANLARAGELASAISTHLSELTGENHLEAMSFRGDLAAIKRMSFHEDEAIAILEPLLRAQTERFGAEQLQTLSTADELARTYYQAGRWNEALPLAEKVRAIAVRAYPPGDAWLRGISDFLAWLYREMGRYADAEALLRESLTSGIRDLGEAHPMVIETRSQLALALMARKRYGAALEEAERALRLAIQSEGSASHRALWMRSIRIQVLGKLQRCEEVIAEADATNEGLRRIHGNDTAFVNPNEVAAARCASQLGHSEEALTRFEQLRRKIERVSPGLRLGHLIVLAELGDAQRRARDTAAAARTYAQFVEESEQAREMMGPNDEFRQGFLDRWAIYYRRLAEAQVQLGEFGGAFNAVERVKSRGLLETLSAQSADGARILTPDERTRLQELQTHFRQQDKLVAETPFDSSRRADVLYAKAESARALRSYRDELGRRHPKYALVTRIHLRGIGDAPNLIPTDSAFLSYAVAGDAVLIFAFTRESGLTAKRVQVPGGIAEVVRAYRSFLVPASGEVAPAAWKLADGSFRLAYVRPEKRAREVTSALEISRTLEKLLLAPVEDVLVSKRKWIISPDRSLALLPFEALPWRGEPVQLRHDISYIQSLSVLGALGSPHARKASDRSLFAMGDPDYQPPSTGQTLPSAAFAAHARDWPSLPGSAMEVRRSAAVFPAAELTVFVNADASEEKLQKTEQDGELNRYRYLLFATHALLNTESPQLSAVVLAQNAPTPQADGYVTAVKWLNYHLESDMIVLSGCETGLVQNLHGEGVTGLPYAMAVAGNRSALLTLWRTDDRFAARFVPMIFARLREGLPPASAVNAAKRAMLHDRDFSSPRYWAAFVLYGFQGAAEPALRGRGTLIPPHPE